MRQLHPSGPLPPGPERRDFLEAQPTYWLKRCYQMLRRSVDQQLRDYGLTLSQRDVLLALWENGPTDQGTLRDRLGLEQSSVSRLVDGLARRGLVNLDAPEADRRVRVASLTSSGAGLLRRTPGSSELGAEVMLAGLTESDRRDLVRLLKHCAHNLSAWQADQTGRQHLATDSDQRVKTED
jgi:MarR family transcriptional regulator for hemolysin